MKSLSYEILRKVSLVWFCCCWRTRLLLACLDWFEGLELGRMIGDQDLMSNCSDIVFEHGVFVYSLKQVIPCCRRLLCERLKKWHARANALLEDLQDNFHIVGLHLSYSPATWCFIGCLCSAYDEWNISSGPQRLLIYLGKCSRNSAGDGGILKKLGHVSWPKRPYKTVFHSLYRELWAAWSAWCDQTDRLFDRMSWILALWTP